MAAASAPAIHRNQVDLSDFINWSEVECLNQNFSHTFTNALSQGWVKVLGKQFSVAYRALPTTLSSLWGTWLAFVYGKKFWDNDSLILESDADEQLLIYIPFNQVVKLHSLVIKGPEEEGPRTVKLFSNKENMGFGNVNDYPPSDTIVLSPDNITGKPEVVKYVKFQNVRSLTIFIEDNQSGADTTKIQKIALYGTTVETTDMKGLKKIEDH